MSIVISSYSRSHLRLLSSRRVCCAIRAYSVRQAKRGKKVTPLDEAIDSITESIALLQRATSSPNSRQAPPYLRDLIRADSVAKKAELLDEGVLEVLSDHLRRAVASFRESEIKYAQQAQLSELDSIIEAPKMPSQLQLHRVFIALGSNMGDRITTIEKACRLLDKHENIKILRTSGLWETKAMYVTDQADFLNGACEVETSLGPTELLDELQRIETALNRVKLIDKGPRTIDLDILLYDDEVIQHERLQVPHKLMLERAFVLEPLAELIPNHITPMSPTNSTIQQHLHALPSTTRPPTTLTPLSATSTALTPLLPSRTTRTMSIINLTPDSFSDGGLNPTSPTALTALLSSHLTSGASILDIGGQSTRPNAPMITAAEETARILPAIRTFSAFLASPFCPNPDAVISIDTFRASVARAAIEAGAHVVNDVSAGLLDEEMLGTVAELGCTVVLMHMRGTPATMGSAENTSYPNGLIATVAAELLARVRAAEAAGIRRWRIILDPGIGFSKTQAQNLELLRRFEELRNWEGLRGLPWLIGASRKGFIGKITGVKEARERTWGTAAVVAASVQAGADVVRVHDVDEMVKVARMADAIWRV